MTTNEARDKGGNTPESTEALVLELIEWIEERVNAHSGEHLFRNGWDGTLTTDGGELARRLDAALRADGVAPPAPSGARERLAEAFAEYLGDEAYWCYRDHSAWAHGTMGLDDFRLARDNEEVIQSLVDIALAAPAPVDSRE